jgi:hypothetical protein
MDRAPSDQSLIAKYGMGWFMSSPDSPVYQRIQEADKMSWRNWSASAARPAEWSAQRGMNRGALAEGGSSEPSKGKTVTWKSDTELTVEDNAIDDSEEISGEHDGDGGANEDVEPEYGPQLPQAEDERAPGIIWVTYHGLGCIANNCIAYHSALEYNGLTLSAGPVRNGWRLLDLKSKMNRPTDAPTSNKTWGYVVPPSGVSAREHWATIAVRSWSYESSPKDYDAVRFDFEWDGWNCNSFTVGVVDAAGGTIVPPLDSDLFPGADFPLPADAFKPLPGK